MTSILSTRGHDGPKPRTQPITQPNVPADQKYVVTAGDRLAKIATKLGVSLDTLLKANPRLAQNPNGIVPGDEIIRPKAQTETKKEAGWRSAPAKAFEPGPAGFTRDAANLPSMRLELQPGQTLLPMPGKEPEAVARAKADGASDEVIAAVRLGVALKNARSKPSSFGSGQSGVGSSSYDLKCKWLGLPDSVRQKAMFYTGADPVRF